MSRSKFALLLSIGVWLFCSGCGIELDDANPPYTITEPPVDEVSQADATQPDVVPCTEPGEICLLVNAPKNLDPAADRLVVTFYKSLPPTGIPDIIAAQIDKPVFEEGTPFPIRLTNITDTGDFFPFIVLYMPGGGQFMPEPGIDYIAITDEPLSLTGDNLTVESPLEFEIAE